MKGTILVSGASGIVGYGILRNLKEEGYRLIGTTIYSDSPANCFSDIVEIVPKADAENYIPCLLKLIQKYKVDMIIPGIEADMIAWHSHRDLIAKTGTTLLLGNKELISDCIDKWRLFQKLKDRDVGCRIESSIIPDPLEFSMPFIIKPRRGYGSKGVVKIDSLEKFEFFRKRIGQELMIQEMVGTNDEEYTVSAFFDKHSRIVAMIALKRTLSREGFTEIAETVEREQFIPVIEELAFIFCPIGPINFQFRKHNDSWKLLEINPRISSSTSIKTGFGYNECKMAVKYFLEREDVTQPYIRKGKSIRYVEDFFIYDDSINI